MHSINNRLAIASLAATVFVGLFAAAPASAASRVLRLSDDTFQQRCVNRAGALEAGANVLNCTLNGTLVACEFDRPAARCAWSGGPYNRAALALLGWPESTSGYHSEGDTLALQGGGNGGGGGIQAPDLPMDNGNGGGGGGIELPDLPMDNGNGGGGFNPPDLDKVSL